MAGRISILSWASGRTCYRRFDQCGWPDHHSEYQSDLPYPGNSAGVLLTLSCIRYWECACRRSGSEATPSFSPASGAFLTLTNPKAYLAFASLFAAAVQMGHALPSVIETKWWCCISIMIVVDFAWPGFGIVIGQASGAPPPTVGTTFSWGLPSPRLPWLALQ